MRNHKICKKAILKFNISWRHNINDFLMYNVLFVQKSSVYNASLTNFRAKKIRELATKKNFYFLFFFSQYALPMVKIWKESEIIATASVVLIKNCSILLSLSVENGKRATGGGAYFWTATHFWISGECRSQRRRKSWWVEK